MNDLFQDIRYALRQLRKNPGFTAVAVVTLALGIGANTTMFTVVNGVLLKALPFAESERLFLISSAPEQGPFQIGPSLSDREYLSFRAQDRLFQNTASFSAVTRNLVGAGDPLRVPAANVTPDFFTTLGVSPQLGRSFLTEEESEGHDGVVILSDRLWHERFSADPHIVGEVITLDGVKRTVIGVMPAGFQFPSEAELWTPLKIEVDPRNWISRPVLGRLKPQASRGLAQSELETLAQHWPLPPGQDKSQRRVKIIPLRELFVGNVRRSLLIFSGAVAFVLLIACANVANLCLARASGRAQELAVRASLGAGRWRLTRQVLTESTLISSLGGGVGILLAIWGLPLLVALTPAGALPRIETIHIDLRVLAFTFGLSMAVGIASGLVPALRVMQRNAREVLSRKERTTAARHRGAQRTLAVFEIALAVILLAGAGLLLKSYMRLHSVNPGFQPENTLTMTLDLPATTYRTATQLHAFDTRVLAELSRLPGVLATGAVNWRPFGDALIKGDFQIEGGRPLPPGFMADKPCVSSGYFKAMGIRTVKGRDFSEHDSETAPGVSIVSESVARALWPGQDVIGKRISMKDHPNPSDWLTIVGVVGDVHQEGLKVGSNPAVYQPYLQIVQPFFLSHVTFVVRTAAPSKTLASEMRSVIRQVDKDQPVATIASMETFIDAAIAEPRFQARLLAVFASVALSLAIVGIYGVLSYLVSQRIHEIGIRLALGAQRVELFRMLLRDALLLACIGISCGIAGALAVTRVLRNFLFEVRPDDPLTFAAVVLVLLCAALAAGTIPGRRAMKVDPMVALRYE